MLVCYARELKDSFSDYAEEVGESVKYLALHPPSPSLPLTALFSASDYFLMLPFCSPCFSSLVEIVIIVLCIFNN